MKQTNLIAASLLAGLLLPLSAFRAVDAEAAGEFDAGLVGYWKLADDCKDYSGHQNHGLNRGVAFLVDRPGGSFNGTGSHLEIPHSDSLSLGTGPFSITAWVKCDDRGTDVIGDVLSKFDPSRRKGITLAINSSSGGYNSQGNNRLLSFGIDDAQLSGWKDCGRPSEGGGFVNNYVNSLTVFDGDLYVSTTHAHKKEDCCHVMRYEGGDKWADCGRVGNLNDDGVGPMAVHDGHLYAATWNYDHSARRPRVFETWDYGHVFRYKGGKEWEDCGQPGKNRRLMSLGSYKGKLYAAGDGAVLDPARECYVYQGGKEWKTCGEFAQLPACLALHDGRLWLACSGGGDVHVHDEQSWRRIGNPAWQIAAANPDGPVKPEFITQLHCMEVYRGRLCVGSWPEGMVAALGEDEQWEDLGCTADTLNPVEINSLVVYNGKLYAGTLPRIGLWRYEDDATWTLIHRLLPKEAEYRGRLTSLTVHEGRLFASAGCSNGNIFDEPCDVRGKVYSIEAGKCVSSGQDLGSGWKHVAAVKDNGRLRLYVDGRLVATSTPFDSAQYDLTTDQPLKIGFGETDYFSGMIREIRLYNRPIGEDEISEIFDTTANR